MSNEGAQVLVTGASGFIGSALVPALVGAGFTCSTAYRMEQERSTLTGHIVGDLSAGTDWRSALKNVDAVVHLAGPAESRAAGPMLYKTIVEGTEALVKQAASAGVQRFVYMSSIKAVASSTQNRPTCEADAPNPASDYGRAKLEAEAIVLSYPSISPVVLRIPLVHSVRARGNWRNLMLLLDSPLPLPLGGLSNRRSLIALRSVIDAVIVVLRRVRLSGVFHVSDGPAVSTSEIATLLRVGMNRAPRLFSAPGLASLGGRALTESLEVDATLFSETFNFRGRDTREALMVCGQKWKWR